MRDGAVIIGALTLDTPDKPVCRARRMKGQHHLGSHASSRSPTRRWTRRAVNRNEILFEAAGNICAAGLLAAEVLVAPVCADVITDWNVVANALVAFNPPPMHPEYPSQATINAMIASGSGVGVWFLEGYSVHGDRRAGSEADSAIRQPRRHG
jgi:hypothetical protein